MFDQHIAVCIYCFLNCPSSSAKVSPKVNFPAIHVWLVGSPPHGHLDKSNLSQRQRPHDHVTYLHLVLIHECSAIMDMIRVRFCLQWLLFINAYLVRRVKWLGFVVFIRMRQQLILYREHDTTPKIPGYQSNRTQTAEMWYSVVRCWASVCRFGWPNEDGFVVSNT